MGNGSFRNNSPKEGWIDSPSGEFAYTLAPSLLRECWVDRTYDIFTEIRVWESHDCLERIRARTMRYDRDVVCSRHSVISMRPNGSGRIATKGKKWEETYEATLINSVNPPNHMTSGWIIASDRFSINFLKPYLKSVLTSRWIGMNGVGQAESYFDGEGDSEKE